jgi:peptidoglycan/LPS O-acetylase OafA/YrhL
MQMLISEKMAAADNRSSGFDYLRVVLALSVVLIHFVPIKYGDAFSNDLLHTWMRPFVAVILPMFFALSGFLVAGSLARSRTIFLFLGLRVIRIIPALAVEIVLSAFILGPMFTTYSLHDYFTNTLFYKYFFNIVGHVQFLLPGVFVNNPHPNVVNEQLWTIPWELKCYLLIAALALLSMVRNRFYLLGFLVAFNAFVFLRYGLKPTDGWVSVHGIILIESFLAGITLFQFRDRVPLNSWLALASFVLCAVFLSVHHFDYLVSIPAAYLTVYIGLLNPPRNRVVLSGDYSYGIYLYGFPIQQAIVGSHHLPLAIDIASVLLLTFAVAACSWWVVERPTLALRRYLPAMESAFMRKAKFWEIGRAPLSEKSPQIDCPK